MEQIEINYRITIGSKNKILEFNGFMINYENKNIIVSINHNLPVSFEDIEVKIDRKIFFKTHIIHRPLWNQITLLKCPESIKLSNKTIKNLKFCCKIEEKFYMSNKKIVLRYSRQKYLPFANFSFGNTLPVLHYACVAVENQPSRSDSGCCVYDEKGKIIGIFTSGVKTSDNKILFFILPIVYLQKTLIKKNKKDIFFLESDRIITKVNNYYVRKHLIFSRQLGMNIPEAMYYMLEGDDRKEENVRLEDDKSDTKIVYNIINNKIKVKNSDKIEYIDNNYIINIPLLKVLKLFNKKELISEIFKNINNIDKIKLRINDSCDSFEIV
jgi:hypothetical protein